MKKVSSPRGSFFSRKRLAVFLVAVLILSLIPVIVLSFYSYPAMDDFIFGAPTHLAAVSGGSFADVLKTAFQQISVYYTTWQGTFTAIPLFSLHPGIISSGCYFLTTFIMLAALILGTFRLCSVLLKRFFPADTADVFIVGSLILLLTVQFFPSVYEALYWFNGSVYYLVFQAFMFFWISETVLFIRDRKKLRLLPLTLLSFLISGGNYVTALLTLEFGLLFLVYLALKKKNLLPFFLVPFAVLCVGFCFNASAPGNAFRSEMSFSLGTAARSVLSAIGTASATFGSYTGLFLLLASAVLIPVFWRLTGDSSFSFPVPLAVFVFSFLFYASSFAPTAFALGSAAGPHRLRNMQYWLFLVLFAGNLFYLVGWLQRQLSEHGLSEGTNALFRNLYAHFGSVTVLVIAMLFCLSLALLPDRAETASLGALRVLLNGDAAVWKAENAEREALFLSDSPDVVLPAHSVAPPLLTSFDEEGNTNDIWSAQKMKIYYLKDSVTIGTEPAP